MMHRSTQWLMIAAWLMTAGCGSSKNSGGDAGVETDGQVTADGQVAADSQVAADGSVDAVADPELFTMNDLHYLGAFRLSSEDLGASNMNYAVGTLGYNPENHSLFVAGHAHHNAIAEFPIPTPSLAEEVTDLPLVETPLQPFVEVLEAGPSGNPDGINRITGLFWVEGSLLVNAESWYDAGGTARDTTLLVRNANQLSGTVDGYFELGGAAMAGGYMGPVPEAWRASLGGTHLTGWASNYSIISRYSVGPSLYVFDPADLLSTSPGAQGPITTTARMVFPHEGARYLGADALTVEEGSAPALWNFLSRAVYAFIVPGTRTFAAFGSSAGVDSGIGYKITQDNSNECGGYCAYAADDEYNYYWLFDLDAIVAASAPHEPRPYAYGRWSVPFDDGGRHGILGGTFDEAGGVLYLALENAGQVGTYDRPPLILAFSVVP